GERGNPSPDILDECSRPGGRGATFSVDGCSRRSAEVPVHQSSFPSYLRTDFNRTLLLPRRGTATTLASTVRSSPHTRHAHAADLARSHSQSRACAAWGRGTTGAEGVASRHAEDRCPVSVYVRGR